MSIFRVFVDGQLFYHPQLSQLAITKAQVKEDAENIDSLTLSAPFSHPYNGFVARYETAKDKVDALQRQKEDRLAQADAIGGFMFALSEQACELTEFDEGLWLAVTEKTTVYKNGRLVFTFQNGTEIEG